MFSVTVQDQTNAPPTFAVNLGTQDNPGGTVLDVLAQVHPGADPTDFDFRINGQPVLYDQEIAERLHIYDVVEILPRSPKE